MTLNEAFENLARNRTVSALDAVIDSARGHGEAGAGLVRWCQERRHLYKGFQRPSRPRKAYFANWTKGVKWQSASSRPVKYMTKPRGNARYVAAQYNLWLEERGRLPMLVQTRPAIVDDEDYIDADYVRLDGVPLLESAHVS